VLKQWFRKRSCKESAAYYDASAGDRCSERPQVKAILLGDGDEFYSYALLRIEQHDRRDRNPCQDAGGGDDDANDPG
jgi:hypothetical protein